MLPYPQPPADHLVKCVFKVIMPCLFGDAVGGRMVDSDTFQGSTMRLFPRWVSNLARSSGWRNSKTYCGCTEDQCATVSSVALALCWLSMCALKVTQRSSSNVAAAVTGWRARYGQLQAVGVGQDRSLLFCDMMQLQSMRIVPGMHVQECTCVALSKQWHTRHGLRRSNGRSRILRRKITA